MGDDSKATWSEQDSLAEGAMGEGRTEPGSPQMPDMGQVARESEDRAQIDGARSKQPNLLNLIGIVTVAGVLGYLVGDLGKPYVRRLIHGPDVELRKGPRYKIELRGDEPSRGPKDALVTIVSFSDYECPHCAKAEKTLDTFLHEWEGEPVRVIYKNYPLPLHERALPAAYSAWAAHKQGKFDLMHKWLFEHRAKVDELGQSEVEAMDIDYEQYKTDLDAGPTRDAVDDDRRAGGLIHLRATPSFVINGHIYTANWSPTTWEDVVEWELKDAKALHKSGVPKEQVFEKLTTQEVPAPPAETGQTGAQNSP